MDSKNVIAAIALSSAVIVLYSLFFIPEQTSQNQNLIEKEKIEQNTDTPSLEQKETLVTISREEALKTYGFFKGLFLAFKRILSCHPLGSSGFDPVKKEMKVKK